MKKRPSSWGVILKKLKNALAPGGMKQSFSSFVDDGLVKLGIIPEIMDGSGKILHISDTPTNMYNYLSRVLRRVNPSVVIHTGDLADDVKLGMYPAEADRYRAAIRRLINVLLAPHRVIILTLGNHDRLDLLPPLPSQCLVCDNVMDVTFFGVDFRMSHYLECVLEKPRRYNLFGHDPTSESFVDDEGRYFLNGIEAMRLIDPVVDEIKNLRYPQSTYNARNMSRGRIAK
jgi:hypothetical protein